MTHRQMAEIPVVEPKIEDPNAIYVLRFESEPRVFLSSLDLARQVLEIKKQALMKRHIIICQETKNSFDYFFSLEERGGRWWVDKIKFVTDIETAKIMIGE